MDQTTSPVGKPLWKRVLATIIDLVLSFFILGYIIALLTDQTTEGGFELNGIPAVALIVFMVAYFILMNRYTGGTIGERVLRINDK